MESIATAAVDSKSNTVSINLAETEPAAAASDNVSVDLAATESASATVAVIPATLTPAIVTPAPFVPAFVPPPAVPPAVVHPPVVVDSDSESEMAESQNTQFAPQKFKWLINENAKDWIRQFENYCQYKEFNADKKMALFKVLLVDSAAVWYDSLSETNTDTWAHVKMAFETRYNPVSYTHLTLPTIYSV